MMWQGVLRWALALAVGVATTETHSRVAQMPNVMPNGPSATAERGKASGGVCADEPATLAWQRPRYESQR